METMRVNGKENNWSVDLEQPIKIDWAALDIDLQNAELIIYHENKQIYRSAVGSDEVFRYLKLSICGKKRKKFVVELLDLSEETAESIVRAATVFYSANGQLETASWITRLDDPIEKEQTFYRPRGNICFERQLVIKNKQADTFLDIAGLGYYDVYINNKKINDYFLNSDATNYSACVYYDTYKINDFLHQGQNLIQVFLGNGWYTAAPLKLLGKYNMRHRLAVGKPMMICQVSQYQNGTITECLCSDSSWQASATNLVFDNLYIGEIRDFSGRFMAAHECRKVDLTTVEIPGPGGILTPSFIEKIKRESGLTPKSIVKQDNHYLIDFGRIISGQIRLAVTADNQQICIEYAEKITESNELDYSTTTTSTYGVDDPEMKIAAEDPVIQKDQFTTGVGVTIFENQFTYHSFRYVSIYEKRGASFEIEKIEAFPTYTEMSQITTFDSSDESLNQLFEAHVQTKKNNIHSYYEDCARERLGYGGDIAALLESQLTLFDSENLLRKVLADFLYDQTIIGGITQTAPYMGIQTYGPSDKAGSLGWQLVLPEIAIKLIKYYGTHFLTKPIRDGLKKHLNYLLSFSYDYIKQCCLGDWGALETKIINGKETPPDREFCSAAMYLILLKKYRLLSTKLALSSEQNEQLNERIAQSEAQINEEFKNPDGTFQSGSHSSSIFALKAGLVEDEVVFIERLAAQIQATDSLITCGIFGMAWSYEIFSDQPQLIYRWLTRKKHPSFFNMIHQNRGILSEYFEAMPGSSLNHAMFSSYGSWFVTNLLGLKVTEDSEGTDCLFFSPYVPEDLHFVKGSYRSIHGMITTSWQKSETIVTCQLKVPKAIKVIFGAQVQVHQKDSCEQGDQYVLTIAPS